ncbi:DgyrCDS4603 [Dimorphilus gyrociliatus]|uniref:Splicing factor 45 n=1 Tax=Dimorphilus gyrociliatus TaxID=2664684 RepID=A0A7I8VH22_9ANNE|nr:DgyrCDS4603 [Dimorphilus gyrociliatus]
MSLYDDIELQGVDKGSGNSLHMLQSQLAARKAAASTKTPTTRRTPITGFPKEQEKGNVRYNQHTGMIESVRPPFLGTELTPSSLLGSLTDEYNPLQPNEYDSFKKLKTKGKVEEEKKMPECDEEEEEERKRRLAKKSFIAPPQNLIEQDKQVLSESLPAPPTKDSKLIAEKIMNKMGWNAGQGLGKLEQGMSRALEVEKTSRKGGRIIHEKDLPPSPPEFPEGYPSVLGLGFAATQPLDKPPIENIGELLKNPSKVVVLRNMVGPGEVDDELEPETKGECQKYGPVVRCVIFELPDEIEENAVRIFVEFERVESATKAIIDLHGRFFGGRVVKANFYDNGKFERLELTDPLP